MIKALSLLSSLSTLFEEYCHVDRFFIP